MMKLFLLVAGLFLCVTVPTLAQDAPYPIIAAGSPAYANAADLDNDGNPDLVFTTFIGDSIYTLLGNGDGTFRNRRAFDVAPLPAGSIIMKTVGFGYFDNDNRLDVVVVSVDSINLLLFRGDGTGGLLPPVALSTGSNGNWLVIGDFDPLGTPPLTEDVAIVVSTPLGIDSVYVFFGNGDGTFKPKVALSSGGDRPFFMFARKPTPAADLLDADNIIVANQSGNIGIIQFDGDGNFQPTASLPAIANINGIVWDFINNDNRLDIAYAGSSVDAVFVRTGIDLTTYNAPVGHRVAVSPFGLASGDFTGDGFIDLAASNIVDTTSILVNDGTGNFLPVITSKTDSSTYAITAVDINNNGLPDLLVGSLFDNSLNVYNLQAPSLNPNLSSLGNPPAGAAFNLPAGTATDSSLVFSIKLLYRQMGKTNFDTLSLMLGAGTQTRSFSGTVPASAMTNRGLEYAVLSSDSFITARRPLGNNFYRLRTSVNENSPATANRNYQLVSFPFEASPGTPETQIVDDFSLTDPNVARLFWWDPTAAPPQYLEHPNTPSFVPGRSMFLATNGLKTFDGVGLSTATDTTIFGIDFVRMPIDTGWNMISTPYPYFLDFDSVWVLYLDGSIYDCPGNDSCTTWLGISGVREYIGGTSYATKRIMHPWKGYFAKNYRNERLFLLFPKTEMIISDPNQRPTIEHEMVWPVDWKIAITAKSGDLVVPATVLGSAESASRGYDRLDLPLPPALPGDFRVAFQKGKEFGLAGDYLSDIRPTLTESETWDFTVEPGGTRAIELNFDAMEAVPADYDVILADKEGRAKQNLRAEPVYRFIASEDRHFELTVAPKTAGRIALLPTKYELYQNLPNPFNPQTLIKYDLPEAAAVRLEVFNILGQKVTTLVNRFEAAGPKSVVWDGTDERGAKVSSGIYFYKISAEDYKATKKMSLVK